MEYCINTPPYWYGGSLGGSNVSWGGGHWVVHSLRNPDDYTQQKLFIGPVAGYEAQVLAGAGSTTWTNTTPATVATPIEADLTAANSKAQDALKELLKNLEIALANPATAWAKAIPETIAAIKALLADSMTNTQAGTIETAAATPSTANELARQAASLTAADVRAAVKGGVDDAAQGDATGPVIPSQDLPEPPVKGDLPEALGIFWAAVLALPMFNIFSQMAVTASGSANICFNIPGFMGGGATNFCFDYSQYASTWNFMGSILFLVNAWTWLVYLFEGY
jgi:hypothetical protein